MAVAAPVAMGVASAALSAQQQSAQADAQATATGERNDAIGRAATNTRDAQRAQLNYSAGLQEQNIATQNTAALGMLAASSSARGISGSRLAATLESNTTQQSGLQLEDLAANVFLENKQIDLNYANALSGQQSYQGMSNGLMLLGAGLQGLQTGLSAYSSGAFSDMGSNTVYNAPSAPMPTNAMLGMYT